LHLTLKTLATISVVLWLTCTGAFAQESPFFVTYTHHLEERGKLDLEVSSTSGVPRSGQRFYFAPYMEAEYGITDRWTSSLYLEGQSTRGDSSVFTGWRLESRYKALSRAHWINPVLYLEYEDLNEASRIQKEIEGGGPDLTFRNALLTPRRNHELESKLILSSDYSGWNISENFIVAKNFSLVGRFGIRIFRWNIPPARSDGSGFRLHFLPGKFCARRGSLRRTGQHTRLWAPPYRPVHCAGDVLGSERTVDPAILPGSRIDPREQPRADSIWFHL